MEDYTNVNIGKVKVLEDKDFMVYEMLKEIKELLTKLVRQDG